ncbi:DUF4174 domain-containing protein [Yoonia sp. 208BN28-4]|uniref:DUF4174 domain-containing protein n=1 Tax=Yoonia sp. 208BN28-4 TaxID=3126505 RepID=UPI0030B2B5A3
MKQFLINGIAAAALLASPVAAQEVNVLEEWRADHATIFNAADVNLDDLIWEARPVIVFAQSPNDPQFEQQMSLLLERTELLEERDVIIITDTDPANPSDARLQLRPRGFMLALLSKDGRVELRKPAPWGIRELSRSIDKMPLRLQEVNNRRLGNE